MTVFRKLCFCALAAFMTICLFTGKVYAQSVRKVYDYGQLLSSTERESLEKRLGDISREYGHDIIVYTADSLQGYSAGDFSEKIKREQNAGINGSGIIFLVAMDSRDYDLYAFGKMYDEIMIQYLLDELSEDVRSYLSQGRYYDAFCRYADRCEEEIQNTGINGPNRKPSAAPIIGFPAGIITGLITVLIMKRQMKTTRTEAMANNYIKQGSFKLTDSRDIFLYSSVHRTKRSSSGSGGGRSGGGHSGGKF